MSGINLKHRLGLVILILVFLSGSLEVSGQVGISIKSYPSPGYNFVYQPGMNGMGTSIDFTYLKFNTVDVNSGFEYRISDWGNLLLFTTSTRHTWWKKGRWTFNSQAGLINGMALFKPSSLYVFGLENLENLYFRLSKRFGISATLGIRWTYCPSYPKYGLIWGYLEIPVGLGVVFGL